MLLVYYLLLERGFLCNCIFFPFNIFGFLSVISTNHHNLKLMVKFFLHISAYLNVIAYFGKIQNLLHIEAKI
jgi:hypothetical protein